MGSTLSVSTTTTIASTTPTTTTTTTTATTTSTTTTITTTTTTTPTTTIISSSDTTFGTLVFDENTNSPRSGLGNFGIIAGAVIAGIFLVLLLVLLCYWIFKKDGVTNIRTCYGITEKHSSSSPTKQPNTSTNKNQKYLNEVSTKNAAGLVRVSSTTYSENRDYIAPNAQGYPSLSVNPNDINSHAETIIATGEREYENWRRFSIVDEESGYVNIESKAIYLELDDPYDEKLAMYQNVSTSVRKSTST